ncbi:T9SS type A sorting domain-containing protein [Rhodocaloribacter litoris]|uniref:T9SS type A sorting domain-containing protein n=1 Tax=Rhodocaloribacter litoris TaxID=2558931 RepID=UPI001423EA98|nr:T9SS type A sorting domain-containing protein [Rhodocaloribacter litoris]QXD14413.1 T9SS type A sorting domain-containing protein [Rhodocaloribacter litoris]
MYLVYANASSLTLGIAPSVVLPDGYAGYNSIYANTGKDMYLTNGSDVRAEQHWWGESPPSTSDFHISGTSTLDYTPYLNSNPNTAMFATAHVRPGTSEALGLAEVEAGQPALVQSASAPMAETTTGEAGTSTKSPSSKGRFVREILERRAERGRAASAEVLLRTASERGNPLAYLAQVFAVGDLLYLGRTQEAILLGEAVLQSGRLDEGATSVVAQAMLWAYEDVLKDEANAARMRQVLALAEEASETNPAIAKLGNDQSEVKQESVGLQSGAYPNPFNPEVTIHYALPQEGRVRLRVFDMLGRQVAMLVDEVQQAGQHRVRFVASELPSGVYLYRIEAAGQTKTERLILLK